MSEFDSSLIPDYIMHDAVRYTLGGAKLVGGNGSTPYNFRCPICGDSKKNPHARRGYVLFNKGNWVYVCHNECGSMSFLSYLKRYYDDLYKKVCIHAITSDRTSIRKRDDRTDAEKTYVSIDKVFKKNELVSILDDHPLAIQALNWVISRGIRVRTYMYWYVCLPGDEFYDRDGDGVIQYGENGMPLGNEYKNRIIIPYYRFGGKWSQFDARAIDPKAFIRYKNLKNVTREPYNIDWLDVTRPFYLLEGCIDSTFIENAISFGGTQHFETLLRTYPDILRYAHNGTVIWDNDEAGYDMIPKSIEYGFQWFNWSTVRPNDKSKYKSDGTIRVIKDINDLILYTDLVDRDENEYIKCESLIPYIESARGGLIKTSLLYGDREAIRREKQKELFDKMNEVRRQKESIRYAWE